MTRKIQLLPEHIIDQIKAGEVIERPASLIKEILENAVDAKPKKILLQILNNGLDLIKIEDNGSGMSFDEIPLAFCRHATSKIERFEDLYKLHTFGFRGEALASIAAISRVYISSVPDSKERQGGQMNLEGGKQSSHIPFEKSESGTTLIIKDLFYNTPARLNFIKSQTSEKNAIKKIVNSFLIENPQIEFHIQFDLEEKQIYPITSIDKLASRIEKIIFKKNASNKGLIHFESEYDDHKVKAWISEKSTKGGSGKSHFLFANHRLFMEKSLHQNIIKSMEGIWGQGETGHYIVSFDVPVNKIDVNVHPNKTHIKFLKNSTIHALLSGGIKHIKSKRSLNTINKNLEPEGSIKSDCLTNQQSHIQFEDLGRNYFLLKEDQSLIIYHKFKLLDAFINKNLVPVNDFQEDVIPLLVSGPFDYGKSIDPYLEELMNLGFDFERLTESKIHLKTLPKWLSPFEPQIITQYLINKKFLTNSTKDLNFTLTLSQWSYVVSNTPASSNYMREINEKTIYKIWQQNDNT